MKAITAAEYQLLGERVPARTRAYISEFPTECCTFGKDRVFVSMCKDVVEGFRIAAATSAWQATPSIFHIHYEY
ncbi:unnamed protein product [Strongylus vulgaris]|uniref:Uncharacterized protein n=1 Tax=Strongylus vulgaris TaxID=40348 RepID=A0A3P7JXL5_STRVU|nr:unnamed protein product [Strongylus vulgaris]